MARSLPSGTSTTRPAESGYAAPSMVMLPAPPIPTISTSTSRLICASMPWPASSTIRLAFKSRSARVQAGPRTAVTAAVAARSAPCTPSNRWAQQAASPPSSSGRSAVSPMLAVRLLLERIDDERTSPQPARGIAAVRVVGQVPDSVAGTCGFQEVEHQPADDFGLLHGQSVRGIGDDLEAGIRERLLHRLLVLQCREIVIRHDEQCWDVDRFQLAELQCWLGADHLPKLVLDHRPMLGPIG